MSGTLEEYMTMQAPTFTPPPQTLIVALVKNKAERERERENEAKREKERRRRQRREE
jgi:hypothetical protein